MVTHQFNLVLATAFCFLLLYPHQHSFFFCSQSVQFIGPPHFILPITCLSIVTISVVTVCACVCAVCYIYYRPNNATPKRLAASNVAVLDRIPLCTSKAPSISAKGASVGGSGSPRSALVYSPGGHSSSPVDVKSIVHH